MTPQTPQGAALSDADIENCIDNANRKFNSRRQGPSGQQMTTYDDWKYWLAREVEHTVRAADRRLTAELRFVDLTAEQGGADLRDVLIRNGFVECDIAACNCGSWHARHGYPERFQEFKDMLSDAGHPTCNDNGNLASKALAELIAERDALRAALTTQPQAEPAGWRPIETAPNDGVVMLANEGGWWIAKWGPVAVSGYRFDQPWRSVMLNHDHMAKDQRYKPPTHWRPLLATPTAPTEPT